MSDENNDVEVKTEKSKRGFASWTPERQRAAASKGGLAAQAKGNAHRFTPDEAREAGKKGGAKVSADREHMAEIGKIGGIKNGEGRRKG